MLLQKHLYDCEMRLLHDPPSDKLFDSLLAEQFFEINHLGQVTSREAVIDWLFKQEPYCLRWEFHDFQVRSLNESLALVTYHAQRVTGQSATSKGAWHSSIWQKQGEFWQMTFHQTSPCQ